MVDRLAGLGGSKWQLHSRAAGPRRAGNDNIIMLTIGEPDADTPTDIIDTAVDSLQAGKTGYAPARGEPRLITSLTKHYSRRLGRQVTEQQFIAVPGTQAALYLAVAAVAEPGADVVVPDPYYATYDGVIAAAGGRLISAKLSSQDRYHLQPDVLEAAVTPNTRVLLLNSPHNPTGATLSANEIGEIGEICRSHDIWIVSDEVYAHYPTDGIVAASPFASPELIDRTIVAASLSKSHAMPGFRMGWLLASEETSAAILPMAEAMMFGTQPFLQHAAATAIDGAWSTVAELRASFGRRSAEICKALDGKAGIACPVPEAGMFVVADIASTGMSGIEFANRLLDEADVAVMPGESFGTYGAGLIRIAVTVPDAEVTDAAGRLSRFVDGL